MRIVKGLTSSATPKQLLRHDAGTVIFALAFVSKVLWKQTGELRSRNIKEVRTQTTVSETVSASSA
jgi:hypothetical protein